MKTKLVKVYDEHPRVQFETVGPSLTVQDAKDECDINYIIESYVRRGITPPVAGSYMDCTSVADYETACMLVAECKSNYEQLPVELREQFKSVESYLSYIADENNLKDCIDKGLIDKSTVPLEKLEEIYNLNKVSETPLSDNTAEKPVNTGVSPSGENVSANS